jgi:uncharacterized membrane protein YqjE
METSTTNGVHLGDATKRIAQRVSVIFENRLQLLMIEAEEERERVLLAILLALCTAVFSLLAGVTLTVIVVVAFWTHSPIVALLALAAIYIVAAMIFYVRLTRLQRDWQTLPATLEQLKKDRECLEKII